MGIVFMIVVGAVLGWLVAFVVRADKVEYGLRINFVGGIIGALIGGLAVSPAVGAGTLLGSHYSVGAIMVCMIGSLALLFPLNLLQWRFLR
ncbi:GlsB/YeaQ/YmgE family stress response membrane protein [Erythrobacter alti]|uniref:GlsB/YeaQ/YmgE family stress response membrane protein n=1 Tax=Erythrobacter alti TaxID=1896145 RepID=UPI0030F474A5